MAEDAPQVEAGPRTRRKLVLAAGILGLALITIAGVAGALLYRPGPPGDLWAPASVGADPECAEGCEAFLGDIPPIHGDGTETEASMTILVDADLDDPIAQWGDCLESVFACLGDAAPLDAPGRADHLRGCVAASACPVRCRERYASRADGELSDAVDAFGQLFLEESAWCQPRR